MIAMKVDQKSGYLVDPASSHILVSKIKLYMSKYKQVCTVTFFLTFGPQTCSECSYLSFCGTTLDLLVMWERC